MGFRSFFGLNDNNNKKNESTGLRVAISDVPAFEDVKASDQASKIAITSQYIGYVPPLIDFKILWDVYFSIPKAQNAVDKAVGKLTSRPYYFDAKVQSRIDKMNQWAKDYNFRKIRMYYGRNSLIAGNFLIAKSDWTPTQLSYIIGAKIDDYGNITDYLKMVRTGQLDTFKASEVLHDRYIEADRQVWGISMFHSLAQTYNDVDGDPSLPLYQGYRQLDQDFFKIIHNLATPRVIYAFDNLSSQEELEDQAKKLASLKPGRRAVLNQKPELIIENMDWRTRFKEYLDHLSSNFDTGIQSASNRLITDPSAMADAGEATDANDDELADTLASNFEDFMNMQVIPAVLGEGVDCAFSWGSRDSMEVKIDPGVLQAVQLNILMPEEVRDNLRAQKVQLRDDAEYQAQKQQQQQQKLQQMQAQAKMNQNQGNPNQNKQKDN